MCFDDLGGYMYPSDTVQLYMRLVGDSTFVRLTKLFLHFVRISFFNSSLKSEATPPVLLI